MSHRKELEDMRRDLLQGEKMAQDFLDRLDDETSPIGGAKLVVSGSMIAELLCRVFVTLKSTADGNGGKLATDWLRTTLKSFSDRLEQLRGDKVTVTVELKTRIERE